MPDILETTTRSQKGWAGLLESPLLGNCWKTGFDVYGNTSNSQGQWNRVPCHSSVCPLHKWHKANGLDHLLGILQVYHNIHTTSGSFRKYHPQPPSRWIGRTCWDTLALPNSCKFWGLLLFGQSRHFFGQDLELVFVIFYCIYFSASWSCPIVSHSLCAGPQSQNFKHNLVTSEYCHTKERTEA
jgi:hypothetical protein